MSNVKIIGIKEISLTGVQWERTQNGIQIGRPGGNFCFISEQHISSYFISFDGIRTLTIGLKCTKHQFKIISTFLKELGGKFI